MKKIWQIFVIFLYSFLLLGWFWDNSQTMEHSDEINGIYAECRISWENDSLSYQYQNKKQDFITAYKKMRYADKFVKGPTYLFLDREGREVLSLYVSVKEMYLEGGYVKTRGKIECSKETYDRIVDYK